MACMQRFADARNTFKGRWWADWPHIFEMDKEESDYDQKSITTIKGDGKRVRFICVLYICPEGVEEVYLGCLSESSKKAMQKGNLRYTKGMTTSDHDQCANTTTRSRHWSHPTMAQQGFAFRRQKKPNKSENQLVIETNRFGVTKPTPKASLFISAMKPVDGPSHSFSMAGICAGGQSNPQSAIQSIGRRRFHCVERWGWGGFLDVYRCLAGRRTRKMQQNGDKKTE
uniref:DDE_Tnp_1_7 domain-containing protein n=1 Tax=Panagrellus redivivus TaxID=6233 RepID=A0A7E4UWN7_PANRE